MEWVVLSLKSSMGKGQQIQKIGCMYLSILKIKIHTYDLGLQVRVRISTGTFSVFFNVSRILLFNV